MRKARASLIAALGVSLLAVGTAGVSTYAWYKASNTEFIVPGNRRINILTEAPDDLTIGSATLYEYDENGEYGYVGTINSSATIDSDFTDVTGDDITITPTPGRKMTFAISVTSTNGMNIVNADLLLNAFSSTNKSNRKVVNSLKNGLVAGRIVQIEEAINIYSHVNTTGVFGTESATDKFVYDYANPYATSSLGLSLVPDNAKTVTGALTAYAFFTIEFSNDDSTYYKELKKVSDSSYTDDLYITPKNDSADRYFWKSDTSDKGSSSCYEGLQFSITELRMIVGAQ